ncbi:hypothetical protein AC579_7755 [Pseudocercospora musae]|uniref:Uncharacterized protein n=1 Tax=Pseudocercospora musae TaxID=113226 RepID=A0A139IJQ8_9PEZI|nr:hypothetical protein AC579_7755 [Pseudocercospora musae]
MCKVQRIAPARVALSNQYMMKGGRVAQIMPFGDMFATLLEIERLHVMTREDDKIIWQAHAAVAMQV